MLNSTLKITAVLFDLDGTLIDTAPDLINALNKTLKNNQYPKANQTHLRPAAAHGSAVLIEEGFNESPSHPQFENWRQEFLTYYSQNLYQKSQLFEGIPQVLDYLQKHKLPWGVVTNKPKQFTEPLMKLVHFNYPPKVIVSGDTCKNAKPHPDPLYYACKKIQQQPECTLYIGDAQRDIEAGKNAKMKTLAASYGYLRNNEKAEDWQADAIIHQPLDIIQWLNHINS